MTGKLTYPEVTGSGFRRARLPCFFLQRQAIGIHFYRYAFLRDSSGQIRRIRSLRRATCRSAHGTVPAQAVSFVSPRVARASSSLSRLLQRAKEEWKWR
jgi:hypothetical protein